MRFSSLPKHGKTWSRDDLVKIIKQFIASHDGKHPIGDDIKKLHRLNPNEYPSEGVFTRRGGLPHLISLAGEIPQRKTNELISPSETLRRARGFIRNFYAEHQRYPTSIEIEDAAKKGLCPWNTTLRTKSGVSYKDVAITLGLRKIRRSSLANQKSSRVDR